MTTAFSKTASAPLGWLATSGVALLGLFQLSPSMSISIVGAALFSASIIFLVSRAKPNEESAVVPFLGAGLFAFLTWIVVSLIPSSSVEAGVAADSVLMARTIVVLTACVLIMPLLALAETVFSVAVVQVIARITGGTELSGELRVVSLIERKFGGLLGSINR